MQKSKRQICIGKDWLNTNYMSLSQNVRTDI